MERRDERDYVRLYRQAFQQYRAAALWHMRYIEDPEPGHALAVARALRYEGDLAARRLAEQIEQACRGARTIERAAMEHYAWRT